MGGVATAGLVSGGTRLAEISVMASAENNANNDKLANTAFESVFDDQHINRANNSHSHGYGYFFYIVGIAGIIALIYIIRRQK